MQQATLAVTLIASVPGGPVENRSVTSVAAGAPDLAGGRCGGLHLEHMEGERHGHGQDVVGVVS